MIHADRFAFAVTGKASVAQFAGDTATGTEQGQLDEVLVAFISVEEGDRAGVQDVAGQAARLIDTTAQEVGAKRIMVYPYAHLSNDLAPPRVAAPAVDHVFTALSVNSE